MKVLALDTSSQSTACALVEPGPAGGLRVLAEALHPPPDKAGDLLPGVLDALCGEAGLKLADVGAIAVGLGPGSFTGLRIGLACAKGLAYTLRVPLCGVSSLHALALASASGVAHGTVLVPALEARRGELFAGAWAPRPGWVGSGSVPSEPGALAELAGEQVIRAEAVSTWLRGLPGAPLLVGPGARQNRAALLAHGVPAEAIEAESSPRWPAAWAVAALAIPLLAEARFDAAALFALAPNYLATSEPEKALAAGLVGKLPVPR